MADHELRLVLNDEIHGRPGLPVNAPARITHLAFTLGEGDASPLAEEAPVDGGDRAYGRLLGLAAPVGLCVIAVITVLIVSRIEGGYWIGHDPRRTDTAQHSGLELLQPPLLVALAGAIGVAAGRAIRHATTVIIAGGVFWLFAFIGSWAWNVQPLHTIAVIQAQPMTFGAH